MSCKLFVANFPYSTTNEELSGLFSPHGNVLSVKIATDRETGRSRGFGFVEMGSEQEAENAIRELDGYQIGGRSLAVRVAEERARPGGPGGPGGRLEMLAHELDLTADQKSKIAPLIKQEAEQMKLAAQKRARYEAATADHSTTARSLARSTVLDDLRDPEALRRAFILREVLGPPVALRR